MDLDSVDIANISLPSPANDDVPNISLPSSGNHDIPNISLPPSNQDLPDIPLPSIANQDIPNISLPPPVLPFPTSHGIVAMPPPLPLNQTIAQGNQPQDVLQNRRRTSSENELLSSKWKQSHPPSPLAQSASQRRLSDTVDSLIENQSKPQYLSSSEFLSSTWSQLHHSNHSRTLSERTSERRLSELSPYSDSREKKKRSSEKTSERRLSDCPPYSKGHELKEKSGKICENKSSIIQPQSSQSEFLSSAHNSNHTRALSEKTFECRLSESLPHSEENISKKCESQSSTVNSQQHDSLNEVISSKWNQSHHSGHSRTFSERTNERRLSECTPYSDLIERRESKEKNVKTCRSQSIQSISLKRKPLYTMADGRQFFASWSPGFKVQSLEELEKMEGEKMEGQTSGSGHDLVISATEELQECSIAESQKSSDCLPVLADLSWEDVVFPTVMPMLAAIDLCRLRAVDRQHHEMVHVYITRNKRLDLSDCKKATKETFRVLTHGAENLRYLNLAGSKWLTDDLLRNVIMENPLLEHINLSACHHLSAGILQTVTIKLKDVHSLILRDCHWVTKDAVQYHIYHQGTGKKLKQVDFTGCWELGDDILVELLSRFPGIRVLRLGNIYSLTDMVMRAVASYCRGIKHLDIKGCWRVTNAGVRLVGEYCRHLKFLEVSDCRDVTEQSLTRLRKKGIRIDRPLGAVAVPRIPELQNNI